MKKKNFDWVRLYLAEDEITPSKRLVKYFVLLHILLGVLHFPLLLLQGLAPNTIYLFEHIVYPLLMTIGFVGIVSNFSTNFSKNNKNPRAFWKMMVIGEFISSFMVCMIDRLDQEWYQYYFYIIFGNALVDAVYDLLHVLLFAIVMHYIFKAIMKRSPAGQREERLCFAVGLGCGFYLFGSEIPETIDYFFFSSGGYYYASEIITIFATYLLYAAVGYACYWICRKGTAKLTSAIH